MSEVFVVGIGSTAFGKLPQSTVKSLTHDAVSLALQDAGALQQDVDAAFFANTVQAPLEGQYMISGEIALRAMGFSGIPITNVENACASASTAFNMAYAYLKAGLVDVALAVGAEKMTHPDKARSLEVFNGAWDVHDAQAAIARLRKLGEGLQAPPDRSSGAGQRSIFIDLYASLAKFHMQRFGTTERQLAAVCAKNHYHSTFNPLSQYRNDMSVEQVLAAPMIAWPLTLPMCAPVSDGAAAAILVREEALSRFDASRAIRVCAASSDRDDREPHEVEKHVTHLLAHKAYRQAGIHPKDISLAEVHDASAFAEILQTENLGFCDFGEGGQLAESGATRLGGRIPVNVSGGLESKGHPIGATGLGQIHDLVRQLRHEAGPCQVEGAKLGIAENGGGFGGFEEAVACITILGREG